MLSKKYRLPVQSVIGKTPVTTYRGRYFSVKRFAPTRGLTRVGVVVPASIVKTSSRRTAYRRALYTAVRMNLELISPGEYLVLIREAYPPQEVDAIIKELMNAISR